MSVAHLLDAIHVKARETGCLDWSCQQIKARIEKQMLVEK